MENNERNMERRPEGFGKVKKAVVEELAKRWILEDISEEGNIEFPPSWYDDAQRVKADMMDYIKLLTAKERGE